MGNSSSVEFKELPNRIQKTRVLGIISGDAESRFLSPQELVQDPNALLKPRKKTGDDSFGLSLRYGFTPKIGTTPQYEKFLERKKKITKQRKLPRPFYMNVIYQVRQSKINIDPYDGDTRGFKANSTGKLRLLENNMAARNIMKHFQRDTKSQSKG
ncbi:Hypothetical predicted protein [Mytilus galloprovincialis]|uniref:Uncharacterized protein n=1 Tax=Mytilus galloprovincialis TaxID=29158 RepID=A0A8B6FU37_MYTGA|nr:Hypothetical predicted protein [Mytilus galloprovincialis]